MEEKQSRDGIALTLSGGGFRATLFHLGALWRLNELGYLATLSRISSVSGGSIIAGVLGHRWKRLKFNGDKYATNFEEEIAGPVRKFCSLNIEAPAVLGRIVPVLNRGGGVLAAKYRKHLFGDATLQDLPADDEGPRFVICATNLQTGVCARFSKPYLADYRLGRLNDPDISLATAVAASSAFPPVLSPLILETDPDAWIKADGADSSGKADMRRKLCLSDGGVYDNLGFEPVKRFKTILASDAGAPFVLEEKRWRLRFSPVSELYRVMGIAMEQTRALRKRHLVQKYIENECKGAYWGIATHIDKYELADAMVKDNGVTASLQEVKTRLRAFGKKKQGQLINWGYALVDAAMRRHVLKDSVAIGTWPTPEYPLDRMEQ